MSFSCYSCGVAMTHCGECDNCTDDKICRSDRIILSAYLGEVKRSAGRKRQMLNVLIMAKRQEIAGIPVDYRDLDEKIEEIRNAK